MNHFLVYHNPDAMGYAASEVESLSVVTDKKVADTAIGGTVWLITGEGQPRTFRLRGHFVVDVVEPGDDEGFRTRIRGTRGKFYSPMPTLNDEEWFSALKSSQGNFAFGFQPLTDPRFVRGLEAVAERAKGQAHDP